MTKQQELKQKLEQAVNKRDAAEQFSHEWFVAKADVEDLQSEINKIEFADRQRNAIPEDFVFVDWDTYDD